MKKNNKYILLMVMLWMALADVWAQQPTMVTVSGTVYEKGGLKEPLPNVAVVGRNPKTKEPYKNCTAITNLDGKFAIKVPLNSELLFKFISFESTTYQVKIGISDVTIYMKEVVNELDETVIVGYQKKSKASVAASVTVVNADELAQTPVSNVMNLLQGRVAGLDIQMNNGLPGASGQINMRGVSDISVVGNETDGWDLAATQPLFVIDGIPQTDVSDYDAQGLISGTGVSPIASLPFEDIANIQILKDAAATSLYGSAGAYGVILIETKRGNSEKPQITYSGNFTVSTPPRLRDIAVGNMERLLRMNQILENDTSRYNGYYDIMFMPSISDSLNPYWNNHTDWQDQFYRVTYNHSHNLSFMGGNSVFNYKINGNYYTEQGIVKNTDFNRYALTANMFYSPNERFSIGADIKLGFTTNSTGSGNAVSQSGVAKGATASSLLPPPSMYTASMAALQVFGVSKENIASNYSAALNMKYMLPYNIRWEGTFNYKYSSGETEEFTPAILADNNYQSLVKNVSSDNYSWYARTFLGRSFDLKYVRLGLTVGVEYDAKRKTGNTIEFIGLPNDYILGPVGHGRSKGTTKVSESQNTFSMMLNPDFAVISGAAGDKYVFTPSLRPELSSVYGTKTKWDFNPSLAVRWNIYKEPFMKRLEFINKMAIRASWGQVVKYKATRYDVWGTYDIKPDNTYGGESYIPIDFKTLPNAQLDPITTTSWNLGYELGLFNNRISLDVDAYYRQIDNQLSTIATPDHSGFEEMKSTETSLVNYGLEFSLTGRPLPLQSDWDLTCNLNFAINRDVITKLPNEARQILNQKANIANKLGMNTTSLLMYINKGVYATDADVPVDPATGKRLRVGGNDTQDAYFKAGDPIWVDMNGDYIIDENDKVIAGNIRPKVTGGFWINLSYKNFSVHTNASFVLRRDIVNKVLADNLAAYTSPLKKEIKELREKAALVPIDSYNFWTKEDPYNAVYPNPFDYTHANVIKPFRDDQTLFIEDGSYFKINTVSLSYRFPKPWLDFFRLRSVVLKASVNNIYTFSGYSGISPESVNGLGRDNSGGYPNSRTWTVGVTIGL